MTHEDRGHYARKHPPNRKVTAEVAEEVKKRAAGGEISCREAFKLAADLGVPVAEIGFTLDMLEVRIVKCQLGLFGYGPPKKIVKSSETVPPRLEEAIREVLVNGRLPCIKAWETAERFGIPKMDVSSACEALNIKIRPCQLGSF